MIQKRSYILLSLILISSLVFGQDFYGINSSRFFPLQNLNNQPADLIRSDSRWHINVASAQLAMVDNFVFNESDFMKTLSNAGATNLKFFLASDQSLLFGKGRLMLPSVSYKINHKHAVAISSNIRADGIYNSSNDEFSNIFSGIDQPELLNSLEDEYFKSLVNSWIEFNFSWSMILLERKNHLFTGGITLKYLTGSGSGYFDLDGIEVFYDEDRIDYFKADVSYAVNETIDKAVTEGKLDLFGDAGIGMDIGVSYSFLPANLQESKTMPYKLKVGLLVGDIGKIKHQNNIERSTFGVDVESVPYSRFNGIETIEALIDSLKISANFTEEEHGSFSMSLPTNVVFSADYCFRPNWYVSGMFRYQRGIYFKTLDILPQNIFRYGVTPRFENEKWGFFLPLSYSNRFGWNSGLAFRWRYIFVGSSTIISNLFNSDKGHGELYLGINIPLGEVD